ncbi:MAG TPA: DUF547 domain-containing protein [Bryobacteraceae bacterium]
MTRRRLLAALSLIPLWSWGAENPSESAIEATARWARVLQRHVNGHGQVDFCGLSKDTSDLYAFVRYIGQVSPQSAPGSFANRNEVLAWYINSYNALSMLGVLESGIPEELGLLGRMWFFAGRRFRIGGRSTTLYTYENSVIRAMGDERVHFALNCMSVGCPRLPRQPFVGAELDHQLDDARRFFFSERRNLQFDPLNSTVRVSEILKFYQEDFLRHSPTLIAYINRFASLKISENAKLEFIPYDWTVNAQYRPCRDGS